MIKDFIHLARPQQYIKNAFVFLPAFFAFELNSIEVWINGTLAFIAFSFTASSIYTLNDWFDKEDDRKHPKKKGRPIAVGRISKTSAFTFLFILLLCGMSIGAIISVEVLLLLLFYYILNIFYTLKLKHMALLDVSVIALCFVLRLLVGAESTNIPLSYWIIVITFLLALFLALAKRRDDVLIFINEGRKTRKVIDGYNLKFLDAAMITSASIVVVAYILWSLSPEVTQRLLSDKVYMTSFFVLLGIFQYMKITFVNEESGNPSQILLKDFFLQAVLIGWALSFVWILYL